MYVLIKLFQSVSTKKINESSIALNYFSLCSEMRIRSLAARNISFVSTFP